jgi:rubredoxin
VSAPLATEGDGRHVIDEAAAPGLRAAVRIRMLVRRLSRQPPAGHEWGEKMKKWQCGVCGFIYDEAQGLPEADIAPGTRWADIPETWVCPDCGAPKSGFAMVEIE